MTRFKSPSENSQWGMIQIVKRQNGMGLYRSKSEGREIWEKETKIIRDEIRGNVETVG